MGLFDSIREPYEHVDITEDNGKARRLTRLEFQALPLSERISLTYKGNLRFFKRGKEVPLKEALDL